MYLIKDGGHSSIYANENDDSIVLKRYAVTRSHSNSTACYGVSSSIIVELSILASLDHENIVSIAGTVYRENEFLWQPMARTPMDLFDYMQSYAYLYTDMEVRVTWSTEIIKQIMQGLCYIHDSGIIHRDIKNTNVLIDPDTNHIRIIDFDLSVFTGFVEGKPHVTGEYAQTYTYRAPEVSLKHENYTTKVDIWSVGMLYIELLAWRSNRSEPVHIFGYPDDCWPDNIIIKPPVMTPADMISISMQISDGYERLRVNDRLSDLLAMNPRERVSAREYLRKYHDQTCDRAPEILLNNDSAVRTFHKTNDTRRCLVEWFMGFLCGYEYIDDSTIREILYAAVRLFDTHMRAKEYEYDFVDEDDEKRKYVQGIASCCLILQSCMRFDKHQITYNSVQYYGCYENAIDELRELELDILLSKGGNMLVSSPIDFIRLWNGQSMTRAEIIAVQTMHLTSNECESAEYIALSCCDIAHRIYPLTEHAQRILDLYENDPLIATTCDDDDIKKLITLF